MSERIRPRTRAKADTTPARAHSATAGNDSTDSAVPELRLIGELRPVTTREERIAMNAYWRAVSRQFAPGHELDDWLAAESDVDASDRQQRNP